MTGPWYTFASLTAEVGFDYRWKDRDPDSQWDVTGWDDPESAWSWGFTVDWTPLPGDRVTALRAVQGADDLVTALPASAVQVDAWDPEGRIAPVSERGWAGALLRIVAQVGAAPPVVVALAYLDRSAQAGTPAVPEVTLAGYDALAVWAAARVETAPGLVAQSVTGRLHAVANAIGWPDASRDFADDLTPLEADDGLGALDVAARASASSGGVLWADPADPAPMIRYRPASWVADAAARTPVAAFVVGADRSDTPPDVPVLIPTSAPVTVDLAGVENVVQYGTLAGLTATSSDAESIRWNGRRAANPVLDLVCASQDVLEARTALQVARTAWPRPLVSPLEVTVYNEATAHALTIPVGATVWIAADVHGTGPGFPALVTGRDLDATRRRCTVTLRVVALAALIPAAA